MASYHNGIHSVELKRPTCIASFMLIHAVIKGGSVIGKPTMDHFNFAGTVFVLRMFWQETVFTGNRPWHRSQTGKFDSLKEEDMIVVFDCDMPLTLYYFVFARQPLFRCVERQTYVMLPLIRRTVKSDDTVDLFSRSTENIPFLFILTV